MHISVLEKATSIEHPDLVNFMQISVAAVLALIVFTGSLFFQHSYDFSRMLEGKELVAAIYLAVMSTCLCYFLQTRAQKHVNAARAGVIFSLEGVFGSLFSVLMGFEKMRINLVVGGGLIVLACILVNIDISVWLKKRVVKETQAK